jgi:hypothetical protein
MFARDGTTLVFAPQTGQVNAAAADILAVKQVMEQLALRQGEGFVLPIPGQGSQTGVTAIPPPSS